MRFTFSLRTLTFLMGKKLLGTTRECFSTRKRAIDLRHERTECEHSSRHLTIDSDRQGTDRAERQKTACAILFALLFFISKGTGESSALCVLCGLQTSWRSDHLRLYSGLTFPDTASSVTVPRDMVVGISSTSGAPVPPSPTSTASCSPLEPLRD